MAEPTDNGDGARGWRSPLAERIAAGEVAIVGKDGQSYPIRPIRSSDAPSLIAGYDAMTERGKWFRMLHSVPHLTAEMAARFCAPDPALEFCLVVEGLPGMSAADGSDDDLSDDILGGARVADLGPGGAAEFSVSLRPEARGRGLAKRALELAIEVAWESGADTVWGLIAARNTAMLGLAKRIGFETARDPDDLALVKAVLKRPA